MFIVNSLLSEIKDIWSKSFEFWVEQGLVVVECFCDLAKSTELVDVDLGQVRVILHRYLTKLCIQQFVLLLEITDTLDVRGKPIVEILMLRFLLLILYIKKLNKFL